MRICILEPSIKSFSRLLSVIANRAPELRKLEIDFLGNFNFSRSQLMISYSQLPCLGTLLLTNHGTTWNGSDGQHKIASRFYQALLDRIGKCCPALRRLEARGFGTMNEGSLKLILKDYLKILLSTDATLILPSTRAILMRNPSSSFYITEAGNYLHEIEIQHPELDEAYEGDVEDTASGRLCLSCIL